MVIEDNRSVKHLQQKESTVLYQYYNWKNQDILFKLSLIKGKVNLHVDTFKPQSSESYIDAFKTRATSNSTNWNVIGITPDNSSQAHDLLIYHTEASYCFDCYYMIAVKTASEDSSYDLLVQSINARTNYTNLLKVG